MTTIAACLKTQLGNRTPYVQHFVGDDTQMSSANFDVNQVAIATLLQYYFKVSDEMLPLLPRVDDYAEWLGVADKVIASFDDTSLHEALKSIYANTPSPESWGMTMDEAINKTRLNALAMFVSSNQPADMGIDLYYNFYTLTIHRCTQSDIDNLSADGNSYVDIFDQLKERIINGSNAELDAKGYSKASYDEVNDTIVFNSNFCIEKY